MANSKQAIKRAKQNAETYKLRHAQRSMVRTAVKAVRASIDANDAEKAKDLLKSAEKILDSSASKKVIHKNAAARTKILSRCRFSWLSKRRQVNFSKSCIISKTKDWKLSIHNT